MCRATNYLHYNCRVRNKKASYPNLVERGCVGRFVERGGRFTAVTVRIRTRETSACRLDHRNAVERTWATSAASKNKPNLAAYGAVFSLQHIMFACFFVICIL